MVVGYTRIPSAFRHLDLQLGSRRHFLAFLGWGPSLISRVGLYQAPPAGLNRPWPPIFDSKGGYPHAACAWHPQSCVRALLTFQRHERHRAIHVSDGVLSRRVGSSCLWFFCMSCATRPLPLASVVLQLRSLLVNSSYTYLCLAA